MFGGVEVAGGRGWRRGQGIEPGRCGYTMIIPHVQLRHINFPCLVFVECLALGLKPSQQSEIDRQVCCLLAFLTLSKLLHLSYHNGGQFLGADKEH